ncbi:MAG: choice-of-anchor tandem repeat GloVer-containing protein [Capsulimonas sp.]|uniref:choice-of-anchor tandem repeat GloVer-containing protein n=1 Tax=Capsulimonas sp. TaxID=2494211 RepID=UPI0032633C93
MTNINVFPNVYSASGPYFGIQGPLIQGSDGNFYGTTLDGGPNFPLGGQVVGFAFKLTPSGTMTYMHIFGDGTVANDGHTPHGGLLQGSDGNFYGTTSSGGVNGNGTFFKLTPVSNGWTETILYHFPAGSNVPHPFGSLVQDTNGNFYGFTGAASVVKLAQSGGVWTQTVLYTFNSAFVGPWYMASAAGLTFDKQGNLWGAMPGGGTNNGVAFKIANPAGVPTVTIAHNFQDGSVANDGRVPYGRLVLASDGNFYGTTFQGGSTPSPGFGTVFKMTPTGVVTILHSFTGGADGANPTAGVIQAHNGYLYGATADIYASYGQGTLFRIIL